IWPTTKPSRAMSRCSSAEVFGGTGMPSGVCTVARRSATVRDALKHLLLARARGSGSPAGRGRGEVARGDRHGKMLVGAVAELLHQGARLSAALLHVGVVARQCL